MIGVADVIRQWLCDHRHSTYLHDDAPDGYLGCLECGAVIEGDEVGGSP